MRKIVVKMSVTSRKLGTLSKNGRLCFDVHWAVWWWIQRFHVDSDCDGGQIGNCDNMVWRRGSIDFEGASSGGDSALFNDRNPPHRCSTAKEIRVLGVAGSRRLRAGGSPPLYAGRAADGSKHREQTTIPAPPIWMLLMTAFAGCHRLPRAASGMREGRRSMRAPPRDARAGTN